MERDSQSSRHRFSWLAPSPLHLLSPFTWTFIRSSSFSFLLFPANSETTVRHRQLFQSPPLSAVVLFLALPSKIRDDSTEPSAISVSSFSCLSFSCSSQQNQRRQYSTVSGYFSLLFQLSFFFLLFPADSETTVQNRLWLFQSPPLSAQSFFFLFLFSGMRQALGCVQQRFGYEAYSF